MSVSGTNVLKIEKEEAPMPKSRSSRLLWGLAAASIIGMSVVSALLFSSKTRPGVDVNSAFVNQPGNVSKLTVSTDNRCGPSVGQTCPSGQCCSQYGWYAAREYLPEVWYISSRTILRELPSRLRKWLRKQQFIVSNHHNLQLNPNRKVALDR